MLAASGWNDFPQDLAIGIVGILGTVAGVLLEHWLKSRGKLHVLLSDWSIRYNKGVNPAAQELTSTREEATGAEYSFTFEAFNGRNEPTGLRDVVVEFRHAGDVLSRDHPQDLARRQVGLHTTYTPELTVINLPPKQWVHLQLTGRWSSGKPERLRHFSEVHLVAKDQHGKESRYTLYSTT
jgi:hypothetical protein